MKLLKPLKLKKIILPNRITVGSMCQYSADNGQPSLWHYGHLQKLALSGAGLLMLESTAVSLEGRITLKDLTLIKNTKGFLTEYSMSTASEDMAEIFSFLMIDKTKVSKILLKDPVINNKINFLKDELTKIDDNFKFK